LCELALKHRTDKGGGHLTYGNHTTTHCHNYTPVYHQLFAQARSFPVKLLEIGVNQGCSLRMWEEYFPEGTIYGFDILPECLFNAGRIKCVRADQSDPASLRQAVRQCMSPFDIIIDDGSHLLEHQVTSMNALLPFMRKDGYYVIEDVHERNWQAVLQTALPRGYHLAIINCPGGVNVGDEPLVVIRHV